MAIVPMPLAIDPERTTLAYSYSQNFDFLVRSLAVRRIDDRHGFRSADLNQGNNNCRRTLLLPGERHVSDHPQQL